MAYPVRKQIYLDQRLDQLLQEHAQHSGLSQAEIIRQALEQWLTQSPNNSSQEVWLQLKAFFAQRATLHVPQKGRSWNRLDLYDDLPTTTEKKH